jgi:hypothetical protein
MRKLSTASLSSELEIDLDLLLKFISWDFFTILLNSSLLREVHSNKYAKNYIRLFREFLLIYVSFFMILYLLLKSCWRYMIRLP